MYIFFEIPTFLQKFFLGLIIGPLVLEKHYMKQKQIIRTIFHYRKFDSTSKTFLENNIESVYELYFSLLI